MKDCAVGQGGVPDLTVPMPVLAFLVRVLKTRSVYWSVLELA